MTCACKFKGDTVVDLCRAHMVSVERVRAAERKRCKAIVKAAFADEMQRTHPRPQWRHLVLDQIMMSLDAVGETGSVCRPLSTRARAAIRNTIPDAEPHEIKAYLALGRDFVGATRRSKTWKEIAKAYGVAV